MKVVAFDGRERKVTVRRGVAPRLRSGLRSFLEIIAYVIYEDCSCFQRIVVFSFAVVSVDGRERKVTVRREVAPRLRSGLRFFWTNI